MISYYIQNMIQMLFFFSKVVTLAKVWVRLTDYSNMSWYHRTCFSSASLFIQIYHCKSIDGAGCGYRKQMRTRKTAAGLWLLSIHIEGEYQCLCGPLLSIPVFVSSSSLPVFISSLTSLALSSPSFCLTGVFLFCSLLPHLFLCSDTPHLAAFIPAHSPIPPPFSFFLCSLLPSACPPSHLWILSVPSFFFTLMGCVRNSPWPSYLPRIPRAFLSLPAGCEGLCTFGSRAISK